MQSFTELSLSAPIVRAITDLGFEKPSPIQAETLPLLLGEPTDFLGLAATGTGKTAAFSIPMLERIDSKLKSVQALILCPTRELALQVAEQIDLLGKYLGVRSVPIYGGASYIDQLQGLKRGANVVVGTPGRVIDHIERGTLRLDDLKMLILDEADEMISMGFKDELEKILAAAPRESSNIWLFSATMSREVRRVADTYLRSPQQVQINRKEMLPSTIEQYYYPAVESNKPEILCKLIEGADDFYGLIFCQTKALVIDLTQYLTERGYKVDCLHGDKDQNSRERTMLAFRSRKVTILVCTDVASRGLDVKDITHVINYSLPRELDNYVHRIGRTARSGKTGIAMNLVTFSHRRLITQIENMTKTRMIEGKIPTRREIGAKIVSKQLPKFSEQTFHARAAEVMSEEWKAALATMTPEEVAGRFLTMMMPEIFNDRPESAAPRAERSMDRREDRRGDRYESRQSDRPYNRPYDRSSNGERRGEGRGGRGDDRRVERNFDRRGDSRREDRREERGEDRRDDRAYARRDNEATSGAFDRRPRERFDRGGERPETRTEMRTEERREFKPKFKPSFEKKTADFSEVKPWKKAQSQNQSHAPARPASNDGDKPALNRRERRALQFGAAFNEASNTNVKPAAAKSMRGNRSSMGGGRPPRRQLAD